MSIKKFCRSLCSTLANALNFICCGICECFSNQTPQSAENQGPSSSSLHSQSDPAMLSHVQLQAEEIQSSSAMSQSAGAGDKAHSFSFDNGAGKLKTQTRVITAIDNPNVTFHIPESLESVAIKYEKERAMLHRTDLRRTDTRKADSIVFTALNDPSVTFTIPGTVVAEERAYKSLTRAKV